MQDDRIEVQVVATKPALTFFATQAVKQLSNGRCQIWTDDEEWNVSELRPARLRFADRVLVSTLVLEESWGSNTTYRGTLESSLC